LQPRRRDGHGNVRPAGEQAARIAASRSALCDLAPDFFINARTDLFLINAPDRHAGLIDKAVERAAEYGLAGANGFFVPGVTDRDLLADLARRIALPVNAMTDEAGIDARCKTGVARISLGPTPYMTAMRTIPHHAPL
jgi:2-methylisocitrate lyase-like PEP mutase family enzyme